MMMMMMMINVYGAVMIAEPLREFARFI